MKAKKFFTAFLLMLSANTIIAESIELTVKTEEGTNGPRTGVPIITASLDNGVISTVVDAYTGDVAVTIEDEDGETVISDVEVVSGHTLFTTNVSSLPDGTYTIIYTLDNNTIYYGVFVID